MKTILLLSFCILNLCLCQAQNKQYTIKGHIDGKCDGMKVIIQNALVYPPVTIDSTIIRNNSFEMKGQVAAPAMYRWIIDKTPQGEESNGDNWLSGWFYLENSDLTFSGDIATLPIYYWDPDGQNKRPMVIQGSATEDLHQSYQKSVAGLNKELKRLNNEYLTKYHQPALDDVFNTAEGIRLARAITAIRDKKDKITLDFIHRHPASIVAYDLAERYLEGEVSLTATQIDGLTKVLSQAWGDSPKTTEFKAKAGIARKNAIGEPYQDIELTNTEGKTVKLSQYVPKGKYIMLEFWASWCGPCRGEIPHLKHVWKEYKDKGFDIVSISIDERNKDWQKALREEKMDWTQLNDPKGDQGPTRKIYNITGVPACILLDKEGRIYKTDMRGAYLDAELENLCK